MLFVKIQLVSASSHARGERSYFPALPDRFSSAARKAPAILGFADVVDIERGQFRPPESPAKPITSSARSRAPCKLPGSAPMIFRISTVKSGSLPGWAVPTVRLMPFRISLMAACWVEAGEGCPAAWWAFAMAVVNSLPCCD